MDKNKIADKLGDYFGDKTVRLDAKQFLANLSKTLEQQYNQITGLLATKDDRQAEKIDELIAQYKELQKLFYELKSAIKESRVDKVEVSNFPEYPEQKEVKIPEYPKEIDIKKPKWYQSFSDAKIVKYIKEGFEFLAKQFSEVLNKHTKKENAFAVRLVDKEGKEFYTAMLTAVTGGLNTSDLAKDSSLNAIRNLTSTTVGANEALDVNVVQTVGGGSGGTSAADDADFTAGATNGTPAMGVYESSPSNVTDGDLGIAGITQDRKLRVDGSGVTQPISVASLPLPSGAATSANQQTDALTDTELRASSVSVVEDNSAAILADTANMDTNLATIAGDTTSLDGKDFATSAKQDTTNTHLSNIDAGKLEEATFTGRVGEVQASPTANTVLDRLKTIGDNQLADGHNVTVDNVSIPVTGTFWQATQPISAANLPLPSGASTSANQSTIIGYVDSIEGLLTTIDTDTGVIAGDTTSIDGKTPSLGQSNKAGSVPVTLASDEDNVNVDIASSVALDVSAATVTVDGTITETNSTAIKNAVEIVDDWDDNNAAKVRIQPVGTVGSGQKTVTTAGTAEVLAGNTAIESVTIKALAGNSDDIYVGDSGVDNTNGFVLDAGETVSMDIDNLADIYIDADTNGDGVSYIYIT